MKARTDGKFWVEIASVSVFLFFSLMLSVPSGYSYGAGLLLLTSIAFLLGKPALTITWEDKAIIYTLLSVFLVSLGIFFLHQNKPSTLDQASRCLLAIPILLFLKHAPPRLTHMWAGLVVGTTTAAIVAAWELHWQGAPRAAGFVTSAIPFGNLALMMGMLCAAGLFWANNHRHGRWWRVALLIGAASGVYCSIASESRGGWVALAPATLPFAFVFLNKRNFKKAIVGAAIAAGALSTLLVIPDSTVRIRYDEAVHEIQSYVQKHDAETSIGARLEIWNAAAINIPQKPWLGWAHKDYSAQMHRLVEERRLDPFVLNLVNTHNNYLEVWLFQGLIGLLALLALYFVPLALFWKRLQAHNLAVRVLAVSGATLIISFFTFGMTHVILGRNNGIIFFVITLAILWGCMRDAEKST